MRASAMTFKQLEAVYWVAELGGFLKAAHKLHTTQSAISKRIRELETSLDMPLFDRTLRSARLTEKGEEMFLVARRLLEQRDDAVAQLARPEVVERRVRIGVTELTAMTWLPRLVAALGARFPRVIVEPHVELSVTLRDALLADEIDLMIVPDAFGDARFEATPVGRVPFAWMCKRGLLGSRKPRRLHELEAYRVLVQGSRSGTGLLYGRWLGTTGMRPPETMVTNSLVALIGMAVSGLGITYLPRKAVARMVRERILEELKIEPPLPDVTYVAVSRREHRSAILPEIVRLAQESCDFSRMYLAG